MCNKTRLAEIPKKFPFKADSVGPLVIDSRTLIEQQIYFNFKARLSFLTVANVGEFDDDGRTINNLTNLIGESRKIIISIYLIHAFSTIKSVKWQ